MIQQQQHYYSQQLDSNIGHQQQQGDKPILSIRNSTDGKNSEAYLIPDNTNKTMETSQLKQEPTMVDQSAQLSDQKQNKQYKQGKKLKGGSTSQDENTENSFSGDENDSYQLNQPQHQYNQQNFMAVGKNSQFNGYNTHVDIQQPLHGNQIYPWMKDSRQHQQQQQQANMLGFPTVDPNGLVVSSPTSGKSFANSIQIGVSKAELGAHNSSSSHSIGSSSSPGTSDSLLATPTTTTGKSASKRRTVYYHSCVLCIFVPLPHSL